ncbi:hypothetical protein SCMU_18350 [Sinomonas cyclohexanicum]|uniref:Uncharacterized protein n=1 Tax=Sinomonas cyclohexanicum TaxID=322009 RepID=A0ABN6FGZ3_SINCY|nr:hypothetical protein [Corynebacterium cyclohexanicum]BCT75993.1 hypothetical protein SCMU_18350 [Corynebacterium cyclohexanicum]
MPQVDLDPETYSAIKKLAQAQDRTLKSVVKLAVAAQATRTEAVRDED